MPDPESRVPVPIATYPGKRALDVIGAALAIVLCSPVILLVALAVWVSNGRPVLFRQERPGLFDRPFEIFKFRTMREATDEEGRQRRDGERLTRLGRFLRVTSLDELPELWNVLKGQMSLVGPRPLLARYLPYYTERERRRSRAVPGITGLAQVSGRNRLNWDERLELDVRYVESISVGQDVRILLRTVGGVMLVRDVEADVDTVETWLDEERRATPGHDREVAAGNRGRNVEDA